MIQDFLTFAIDGIILSYITLLTLEFFIDILPPKLPSHSWAANSSVVIEQMKPLFDTRLQSAKPTIQLCRSSFDRIFLLQE